MMTKVVCEVVEGLRSHARSFEARIILTASSGDVRL